MNERKMSTGISMALGSRKIVAKEAYGYFIMSTLAILVCCLGMYFIFRERNKDLDQRNPGGIILGICITAVGGVLIVLTMFFLLLRSS